MNDFLARYLKTMISRVTVWYFTSNSIKYIHLDPYFCSNILKVHAFNFKFNNDLKLRFHYVTNTGRKTKGKLVFKLFSTGEPPLSLQPDIYKSIKAVINFIRC